MMDVRMMDVHTFVLAGFVSQATFALTLALLAWSDQRARGTVWLSAACVLQLAAVASRFVLPPSSHLSQSAGSCLLVLFFFFLYMGLRWFVLRRRLATRSGPIAVSIAMAVILVIGFRHEGMALLAARAASIILLGFTVSMLLRPRIAPLRKPAHATAAMLTAVMAVLVLQLLLGLPLFSDEYLRLVALDHDVSMACITLLGFSFVAMYVAETKRRLHEETRLDSLTGLRNRRAFEEIATHEVQLAAREGTPLTLLMMDLDHFKMLNDTWGHAFGDRALRAFGGVLLTVTGNSDSVARLGGEEFAILLPNRSARSALAMAERLRATVDGLHLSEGEDLVRFTVSVGLSTLRRGEQTLDAMLRRADRALYQAKSEGRNRVVLCDAVSRPFPPGRAAVPELHSVGPTATATVASQGWREFAR
jgi:diguanylate cyclase (GGDEF)-like protein